ncbi:hypothetical protein JD844_014877 [Phrynosoma platyrhinos]|uniref:Tectonic family member 2 n=1 Tax=Phrynosoma platyrhinos TaxID=52577 RepID=A0ABQ7T7L0_PHRPL|nr:hypothetical protein JD844_014877 [Phrynosoma platyrhinos]
MLSLLLQQIVKQNVSRVTVRLTRNLQLCTSNVTNCCMEALCLVEALQVSACRQSVVVARLLIQAEIYANTSSENVSTKAEGEKCFKKKKKSNSAYAIPDCGGASLGGASLEHSDSVSENTTVIPNQVFQPLGSCPCNLTAGACDIRCCCDLECTSEMKQLFSGSCYKGPFGGDVSPPFDQLCSVQTRNNAPDWFPFLCVQSSLNNTPFLGYFYHGSISSSYQVSSFKIPLQTVQGKLSSGYRQGDPILTILNAYFTVPQLFIAGQCARNSPVAFLQNFEAECLAACNEGDSPLTDILINSGTGDTIKLQVTHEKKTTNVDSCAGRECRNVTFAEDYQIIWEGKRIVEMKVKVLFGDTCPEGYQVGKPVRAAQLNSSDAVTTLNLWKPVTSKNLNKIFMYYTDGYSLCTTTSLTPLLFGLNSVSGCLVEIDVGDNCTQLREKVVERFSSLVQANYVGKRGNSNASVPDDWTEIIRLNTVGPNTNESLWNLKGICLDIPGYLNIQIITADVGAIEGIAQQEILGVQLRFQINYTEYDCRRNDVCWPELFYPLTPYYAGELYSHSLAKGLMLIFFVLIGVVLSDPWSRIYKAWNKP